MTAAAHEDVNRGPVERPGRGCRLRRRDSPARGGIGLLARRLARQSAAAILASATADRNAATSGSSPSAPPCRRTWQTASRRRVSVGEILTGASMTNSSSWCRCRVHWRITHRGDTSPAPKAQAPKASPFAAASAPSLAPPKPADRTVRWPHRRCRQWWSGPLNACPVRQTRPEHDITPVHLGSKRPHTTCSPAGIRCGSRQNASLTNRLNKSGGSNVSRGWALTVPGHGVQAGSACTFVEFGDVVVDVVEVVLEGRLAEKRVNGVHRLDRVGGQGLILHQQ